ncbi:putative peptidyl-prolyl isomerase [Alcanivorax hongdengensis A-11-3]|uniref:peptidylprolyl isomerase n=1 Tax=Alcanivorax hongdengensis A-11-3 TaxID=1177179 RepID=L0WFU9_9GAMM|nr:peptidylprolyl isomerase [Alcanivorax hongdengensis]EKF75589.1 putative peptidyl-prolyl isomerase [Alcanivorax hongdengensis A-11-3]
MKRILPLLMVLLLAAAAVVVWHEWPLPGDVAARVNGEDIPLAALDVFVAASQVRHPEATRESVLKGLVENRLLASVQTAAADSPSEQTPRVGYDRQTRFEQQRFKLVRTAFSRQIKAAVERSGVTDVTGYLSAPLALDENALAPMLSLQQQIYAELTPEQQDRARDYVLARYRFAPDQPEQTLTLWDLYRRQNVQLKVQMQNLNLGFIREAVRQYLATAYVLYWFEHESGLDAPSRQAVDRCVADAMAREALLEQMGLHHDMHDDNPALRNMVSQVTAPEIAAYYQAHKDEFIHVQRVHARHIRLDSQQQADRVYADIQQGLSFDEALQRYSVADDRRQGGELGWIDRDSRLGHWTLALAFVQPANQVSRPFRSPDGQGPVYWEILLVDQRDTAYQPVDSEAVRYRAGRAVAHEKLLDQFRTLLADTTDQARVRIHHEVL